MKSVLDAVDFGVLLLNKDGTVELANRWIRERCASGPLHLGVPLEQCLGGPIEPRLAHAVRACLDFGNSTRLAQAFHPMPLPLVRPGDATSQRIRQAVDVIALKSDGSPQLRCLLQVRDVTPIVQREQVLRTQARQLGTELDRITEANREIARQSASFREIARLAPVGLFETDPAGLLVYANARSAEMLGLDPEALLGQFWTALFTGIAAAVDSTAQGWQASATAGVRFGAEFAVDQGGQTNAWMRLESTPLNSDSGLVQGHIFTLVDVTELHEQARRSELRANHDALTGLANRALFEKRLRYALTLTREEGASVAVLFIDLDRFKSVNDLYGHHAGDVALKTAATRIRRSVRADDLVARVGGDEFAVLLMGLEAADTAQRLAKKVEHAVGLPIQIGNGHVRIGASVGFSLVPPEGTDVHSLLQKADAEMYRVKRQRSATNGGATEVAVPA
jgi:diguanylate cyclase (GGDEF)-like protein/PAS domain S-box-containing protein